MEVCFDMKLPLTSTYLQGSKTILIKLPWHLLYYDIAFMRLIFYTYHHKLSMGKATYQFWCYHPKQIQKIFFVPSTHTLMEDNNNRTRDFRSTTFVRFLQFSQKPIKIQRLTILHIKSLVVNILILVWHITIWTGQIHWK